MLEQKQVMRWRITSIFQGSEGWGRKAAEEVTFMSKLNDKVNSSYNCCFLY